MSGSGGRDGGRDGYDTNVEHYSINELLDLVGLGGVSQIQENEFSHLIDGLVEKYRNIDSNLSQFFVDVGQRIYNWLNTSLAVGRVGDGDGDDGDGVDDDDGDSDVDADGDDGDGDGNGEGDKGVGYGDG